MNAIALAESLPVQVSAESPPLPDTLLNCVALAMSDPLTDVVKLEALRRMQQEIVAEQARLQFVRAMRLAQAEMQPILRTAQNSSTNSKYAPLEVIDAAIRPIYTRHGFGMEFNSEPIDGGVRLICEVTHDGGHMKTRVLEAALDSAGPRGSANKTPVQALVSSTTYLRRTLTCMVWNLALTNEDNDGNRQQRNEVSTGLLSIDQLAELSDLMRQTRTDERKFLDAMTPELQSIEHARSADFPRLKNALLTKKSVLAQRWRASVQAEDAAKAARNGAQS